MVRFISQAASTLFLLLHAVAGCTPNATALHPSGTEAAGGARSPAASSPTRLRSPRDTAATDADNAVSQQALFRGPMKLFFSSFDAPNERGSVTYAALDGTSRSNVYLPSYPTYSQDGSFLAWGMPRTDSSVTIWMMQYGGDARRIVVSGLHAVTFNQFYRSLSWTRSAGALVVALPIGDVVVVSRGGQVRRLTSSGGLWDAKWDLFNAREVIQYHDMSSVRFLAHDGRQYGKSIAIAPRSEGEDISGGERVVIRGDTVLYEAGIFTSDRKESLGGIYLLNIKTGASRRVTPRRLYARSFVEIPGEESIFFSGWMAYDRQGRSLESRRMKVSIYRINLDGTGLREVIANADRPWVGYSWGLEAIVKSAE